MADFMKENDIKLTPDELRRLDAAFKDEKFLKLFQEYVEDINSEKSRKKYEEEIILLEKERGYNVKFVHPSPCYVIKFVINEKKTFVNICKNQYAGKPTYEKRNGGTDWKIPVILSKPRDDTDRKGSKCRVYDVMFHPETIEMAVKDRRFKGVVEDTAISMILENFGIQLDAKTAKYPKLKYKGKSPQIVLRKKIGSDDETTTCEPLEDYWKTQYESDMIKVKSDALQASLPIKMPEYTVKYRDIIDMKDFSAIGYTDKCAPKEIIVEIKLPNVKNASEVELDVSERKLTLKSCQNVNHKYKLDIDLSYAVKPNDGNAKYDKVNNKLIVTLPLKDRGIPVL